MPPSNSDPLSHLPPQDCSLFYEYGIGPSRSVPFPLVHHAFEHHARTQPSAIAVEHNAFSESISYGALDARANKLARRLRDQGIRPGKRVCIVARRSISLVVAILAVLKAGGQYVPLDAVTITDETLKFVLHDSSPTVVLEMNEYAHRIAVDGSATTVMRLEDAIHADAHLKSAKVDDSTSSPLDGCYCIYTSGTTGTCTPCSLPRL
jgi:non-ribosomal peptide synthetase component F